MNAPCQNCKKNFEMGSDDISFCEKMRVPAPTFCPDCRRQRRFAWRNERTLYKRKCDLCQKDIIGLYPAGTKFPVYCHDCWFSDKWDPLAYGSEYDFSKPFFEQFKGLARKVPRLAIWVQQSTNSDYTNQSYANKNVYLSFAIRDSEDSAYCCRAVQAKQCLDDTYTHHSELVAHSVDIDKSYRSRWLEGSETCVESGFLANCRNCQNCFGGVNLRSASHVFFGEKLDKQAYEERISALDLGSRKVQENLREKLQNLKLRSIFRFATLTNTIHSQGDHLSNAKNCHHVFDGFELENARYSSWVFTSKEISDCYGMGGSEFVYEGIGVEEVNNVKFCNVTDGSNNVQYGDMCSAGANLFGCVGLRSKQYCVLNRQYSQKEYEALVPKIIEHMNTMPYTDKKERIYRYGEFFPAELSPFAYNETIAQEAYPLDRAQVEIEGYAWREPEDRHYSITMQAADVPDSVKDAPDSITDAVIGCAHATPASGGCNDQCSTAFRITKQELQLCRQMDIPLPILCPNCRHYERLRSRNPLALYRRECQCAGMASSNGVYKNNAAHPHGDGRCQNVFETIYALARPETIYCEDCYRAEVE